MTAHVRSSPHVPGCLRLPGWERAATELLRAAERRIRLVATCKPQNLEEELGRVERAFAAGRPRAPRFRYVPVDHRELRDALGRAADELDGEGALGALYAARARELALEAEMCGVVGTRRLAELARSRYQPEGSANTLARRWLAAPIDEVDGPRSRSDDDADPASLLCRMRRAVGERRLPLRVAAAPLLSRAATGAGVILVAEKQLLSPVEVERTVLHEIDGHALPRVRAWAQRLGIFRVGCPRGSEEQEGYAIALEEEAGWLDGARRRELAQRHLAARAVRQGADFVETVAMLGELGARQPAAVRIATRVHRAGGLAREIVYLPAFVRVRAAFSDPLTRRVLGSGRVAMAAVGVLTPWQASESWANHDEYPASG